jgi:hypothetical protein
MAFKPKQKKSSNGPSVDWDKVNEQLPDEGSVDARVALVIDLGEHHQGMSVNGKGVTYVATEEEAWDLVDQAEDIVGETNVAKDGLDKVEEVGEVWILPFKILGFSLKMKSNRIMFPMLFLKKKPKNLSQKLNL